MTEAQPEGSQMPWEEWLDHFHRKFAKLYWWIGEVGLTPLCAGIAFLYGVRTLRLGWCEAFVGTFGTGDLYVYCLVLLGSTFFFCCDRLLVQRHTIVIRPSDPRGQLKSARSNDSLLFGSLGLVMLFSFFLLYAFSKSDALRELMPSPATAPGQIHNPSNSQQSFPLCEVIGSLVCIVWCDRARAKLNCLFLSGREPLRRSESPGHRPSL
jgi:hypothetical protein